MTINNLRFLCLFSLQLVIASSFAFMNDGLGNIAFGSAFLDNRNITVLDYTGDVAIIEFSNGTTYNLNVPEYSECVGYERRYTEISCRGTRSR